MPILPQGPINEILGDVQRKHPNFHLRHDVQQIHLRKAGRRNKRHQLTTPNVPSRRPFKPILLQQPAHPPRLHHNDRRLHDPSHLRKREEYPQSVQLEGIIIVGLLDGHVLLWLWLLSCQFGCSFAVCVALEFLIWRRGGHLAVCCVGAVYDCLHVCL